MLSVLRRPHPFIFNYLSILIPGACSCVLLLVLRPFGLAAWPWATRLIFAVGTACLASFSVWIVVRLLLKAAPKWTAVEHWTIGKEIALVLLVMLAICMLFFTVFWFGQLSSLTTIDLLTVIVGRTFAISLFPILVLVLAEQYHYQRTNLRRARLINQQLQLQPTPSAPNNQLVQLTADNGKLVLQLPPAQLYYLQAAGNYIEVYYRARPNEPEPMQRQLIRSSLKAIIQQLPTTGFFHCQKSYLINLMHIQRLSGNARQLTLHLADVDKPIPVSRNKASNLQQLIRQDEE